MNEEYHKPPKHIQNSVIANTPKWLVEHFKDQARKSVESECKAHLVTCLRQEREKLLKKLWKVIRKELLGEKEMKKVEKKISTRRKKCLV